MWWSTAIRCISVAGGADSHDADRYGRTRVYSRSTGLLVPTDPNLESEVRQTAEQQIAQAALDDGILEKARQNARNSVTALLYGLGFRTVDVGKAGIREQA